MRVTCKHCGGAHPAFDCKKSTAAGTQALPVDTNSKGLPSPVTATFAGTVGNEDRQHISEAAVAGLPAPKGGAGSSPGSSEVRRLAADQNYPKRKRGRPKTITDMRAYKAAKQREYRERKKSEHQ